MNRLYAFVGWAIVALGGLHMLTTIRLSASTPAFRVWFFGAGMAMALAGALNLLNRVTVTLPPACELCVGLAIFSSLFSRL